MGSTGPNIQRRGLDADHQPPEMVGDFALCTRYQFATISCSLGGNLSKFWEKFDSGYMVEFFKFGLSGPSAPSYVAWQGNGET